MPTTEGKRDRTIRSLAPTFKTFPRKTGVRVRVAPLPAADVFRFSLSRYEELFCRRMTDSFTLAGRGPARLNNGFVGHFVSDCSTFFTVRDVISSHGDPLDFVTGDVDCDPL